MGVFHAKGWWPKSSCPPSKVCLPWVSIRGIWNVPGFLPGCPRPLAVFKNLVQKKSSCASRCLFRRCRKKKTVFAEKGARFRREWGSEPSAPSPLPSPGKDPPPLEIFSKTPWIFSKTPTAPQEKGGGGGGGPGVGGGGRGPIYRENEPLFRRKLLKTSSI